MTWQDEMHYRARGRLKLPWVKLGIASGGAGALFAWQRVYRRRGRWTPFVFVWRRYPWVSVWNGVFPFRSEAIDALSAALQRLQRSVTDFDTAKALWKLLDDIDTLDDACRGNNAAYRERVRSFVAKRFAFLDTDGYELYRPAR